MNKLFLKENQIIKRKSLHEEKSKQKHKKLSLPYDFSTKKYGSGIEDNQKIQQKINLLLSQNYKSIFNPYSFFKKENPNKAKRISIDISNSNALMKTTEENLISNINDESLFPQNSLSNYIKRSSLRKSDSVKNKIEGTLLKNVLNFFKKNSFNEIENFGLKRKNSSKIITSQLMKEIEKENNKIISQQKFKKRNSAFFPGFNKNNNINTIFKFGENKKRKSKVLNQRDDIIKSKLKNNKAINRKRRMSIFTGLEGMQIKSLRDIGLQISKKISKVNVKGMKKEMKELETSEIEKYLIQNKGIYKKRASLEESNIIADLSRYSKEFKLFGFQERFRNLFACKNLYDSLDDDEFEDPEKSNIYYIAPNTISCYVIDLLVLIASIISLIYIPLFLALILSNCKFHFVSGTYFLFIFLDIIYYIDLITGFFRAYYNFEEVLIVKKRHMCLNYLKGSFIFDLIEAIPFFIILNQYQENCEKMDCGNYAYSNNLKYSYLILKILKVLKLNKNSAAIKIDRFLSKNNFFSDWKALLTNIFFILCSLHLVSCYFIFLGKNSYPNWILEAGLLSQSFIDIYLASIYYVMTTLTTVGYGDIPVTCHNERIFQIFLLIVGTLAYSWLLTYISNYIKKNQDKYKIFEEKLKILDEIKINYPNLDIHLYERIIRYLNYNKSRYKYDVKYVLDSLPSSIQNNLIIEIYKPIIKNFQFFKYLENSDFLVKIVTSMKPMLAMKDDVLIHEGDVIEDIIFIKSGVLSLEIGINLDNPKQYVEEYLNMSHNNDDKNFKNNSNLTQIQSINPLKINNTLFSLISNNTKQFEIKQFKKKYLKIIELRKNEHFGDALMILNEKSPVNIRVSSKKAELLFLQKTDATEISNVYPYIWKRIVNKSLYNMKQIKNITKRKIILYCELNNIYINSDLKKKVINNLKGDKKVGFTNVQLNCKSPKNNKKFKSMIKTVISEVDESIFSMKDSSICKKTNKKSELSSDINEKKETNKTNKDSIIINNEEKKEEKNNSLIGVEKEKSLIHNTCHNNLGKNNIGKEKIFELIQNNINSILEGRMDNNLNLKEDNKIKSTIFSPKKWQSDEINKIKENYSNNKYRKNIHKPNEQFFERINEEQYLKDDFDTNILNKHILMYNYDDNNLIFQQENKKVESKEKNEDLIYENNNYNRLNKLLSGDNISEGNNDKILIDNKSFNTNEGNKKINIYNNIVINNSNKNDNNFDQNFIKPNKFIFLSNSLTDSFTINSTYENINKISNYKYAINSALRQKVKKLIQNPFSGLKTVQLPKNIPKSEEFRNSKTKIERTHIHNKQTIFSDEKTKHENRISSHQKSYLSNHKPLNIDSSITQKHASLSPIKKDKKRNNNKNNYLNSEEGTFYAKIQILNGEKKPIKHRDKSKEKGDYDYEDEISKNIEKNKQNLNNPEEYFSGFFNKILSTKNIRK